MGIYAGTSPLRDLALTIPPREKPLGICTSSGTVGPSISFGYADAAVAISDDISLADAAATALGNAVGLASPLADSFQSVAVPGIEGALVIRGRRWRSGGGSAAPESEPAARADHEGLKEKSNDELSRVKVHQTRIIDLLRDAFSDFFEFVEEVVYFDSGPPGTFNLMFIV